MNCGEKTVLSEVTFGKRSVSLEKMCEQVVCSEEYYVKDETTGTYKWKTVATEKIDCENYHLVQRLNGAITNHRNYGNTDHAKSVSNHIFEGIVLQELEYIGKRVDAEKVNFSDAKYHCGIIDGNDNINSICLNGKTVTYTLDGKTAYVVKMKNTRSAEKLYNGLGNLLMKRTLAKEGKEDAVVFTSDVKGVSVFKDADDGNVVTCLSQSLDNTYLLTARNEVEGSYVCNSLTDYREANELFLAISKLGKEKPYETIKKIVLREERTA